MSYFFKQAIVMALESMQESVEDSICRLLKSLFNSCLVTPDQMQRVSTFKLILTNRKK